MAATARQTASIFADMSLDGPEIGSLVVVIDRARNLPNRKTMGKQDPYCCVRVGKEAKKTETDRRGGQTPRWDQELRFTVHESLDYYKLKCSVFNDDKKIDLIGESWLDLKEVVVPGGGQNDLWHQLQFKGKYAGEIRMELTYYDTRPKNEMVLDKRREKSRHNSRSIAGASDFGGSKQLGPREIKRRPLPPSPASTPPSQNPLREPPPTHRLPPQTYEQAIFPQRQVPQERFDDHGYQHPSPEYQQPHAYPEASMYGDRDEVSQDYDYDDLQPYEEAAPIHEATQSSPFSYALVEESRAQSQYAPQPLRQTWDDEQRTSPASTTPSAQRWSSPTCIPDSVQPSDQRRKPAFNRYSTSPTKNGPFRDSPLRQSISHHDVPDEPDYQIEEQSPPPPPAHRQVSATASPQAQNVPGRQPLPVSSLEARSPLQTIERSYDAYNSSIAQLHRDTRQQSLPPRMDLMTDDQFRHSTGSYSLTGQRSVVPPPRSGSYDHIDRYDESQLSQDSSRRHSNIPQRMQDVYEQGGLQPAPRSSTFDDRLVYSSNPPLFRPRAVSPNALRHDIPRSSVSPSASAGGRESSGVVPFGPDAYELINPVRSSPASSQPQSPAETSSRAMEEVCQSEVESLRGLGPIIGNDGREIDPTDHLPSDTWAPEPERKNRKPEVVIRFKTKDETRRTPVSSPASARPQSYAAYGSSPAPMSGESPSARSGRNRLQKQALSRPLPVQPYQHANSSPAVPQQISPTRPWPTQLFQHPNSSPSVPTAQQYQTYATPLRKAPNRPAISEYSVNGHEVHSSPLQRSPYDNITLPPVPAKIPLHVQEQYRDYPRSGSYDSLSAELSSIDIGPSRGGRTGLRSSRGY